MNRSRDDSVLCNKTFLVVQNAYSRFSHFGSEKMKCKSEIKRPVKSHDDSDVYIRLTH